MQPPLLLPHPFPCDEATPAHPTCTCLPASLPCVSLSYSEKFRCCEPAEGTYEVSCPGNSTTTHQRDWKRDGSGMFADTVLTPETAAVCTTVFGEPSCPPFVGDTGCVGVVMECTVNPKAAKCGCPFRDGIKVQATGYSLDFEFLTCNAPDLKRSELVRKALGVQVDPVSPKATVALQEKATRKSPYYSAPQAPTAGTVYIGAGARFQGAIDFVTTSYGAEERKGTFEYLGVNSVTGPAPTPLPKGVPLVSTPQLKIRLLEQKHY